MNDIWSNFEARTGLTVARGVSLRRFSSLGIGGLAAAAVTIDDQKSLAAALKNAAAFGIPVKILGGGTNVVFTDEGYSGLLVRLGEIFRKVDISDKRVVAGAALSLTTLITRTMESGLSGLEKLTGVPGTLGGAIFQNSGARDYDISQAIASVTFLDIASAAIQTLPKHELGFGYRTSRFHRQPAVILSAELALTPAPRELISAEVTARMKHRNTTQPPGRSVGCIFKNPAGHGGPSAERDRDVPSARSAVGKSAGQLIDESGLKGRSVGGLTVSEVHGNFFVNDGRATFSDFESLVDLARATVKNKYGIDLELEVEIVRNVQTASQNGPVSTGEIAPGRKDAENRPLRRWKISGEGNFI